MRTDMAKRKRLADLEAMHQAAAEDYWTLGAIEVATHTPVGLKIISKEWMQIL